jgi:hypothetical protein
MADAKETKTKEVLLRTYVLAHKKPARIVYSEHMPKFEGFDDTKRNKQLVWGVQGTVALNQTGINLSQRAAIDGRTVFGVDISGQFQESQLYEDIADQLKELERTGYLHIPRQRRLVREYLQEVISNWLIRDPDYETLKLLDVDKLLMARPMMVHKLMKEVPALGIVIHQVRLPGRDPGTGLPILIGVMNKKLLTQAEVRLYPEIKVTL